MNISQLIAQAFPVQYVYSYPTTRMYDAVPEPSWSQVDLTDSINVYIHIPFCNQQCSFCGYLTVIERQTIERDAYVDALITEIARFKSSAQGKTVATINFGGGTPSLLALNQIDRIMHAIEITFPNYRNTSTELSMEATPESLSLELVKHLHSWGFNRISIGIQTLDSAEISRVKRHNFSGESIQAIELVKNSAIPNLCIDLMYGLPGQTEQSWQHTLETVVAYQPETIELYRTVVIPKTRLAQTFDPALVATWQEKYRLYQLAHHLLIGDGYIADSHVRYVRPSKGFYHQQANVFKGQSLVGFGVGARSYGENVHLRNVYTASTGKHAVKKYIEMINQGQSVIESAYLLNHEEQARRYCIYNLELLDTDYVLRQYGFDVMRTCAPQIAALKQYGMMMQKGSTLMLTDAARYHRDLLAYQFFSRENLIREKSYYGAFLDVLTA